MNDLLLNIKGTPVLEKNLAATTKIVVNEGGSRSSKTYSIAQALILYAMEQPFENKTFTICRKTLPSLKTTAMRDFFDILTQLDLYNPQYHNKSDNTYKLSGNLFEFMSLDQPQKKRGAKRDYLWMNEANEDTYEDFVQLSMRTTEKIFMDYNPSEIDHWIYDKVIPRDDCTLIKSTYRDNPFIPKAMKDEIERLKSTDKTYWTIYGLGERAVPSSVIYPSFVKVKEMPKGEPVYGIDFGYNNPSAIVQVVFDGDDIYLREELYETHLTNSQLIDRIKEIVPENTSPFIYADSAEPDRIEEIYRAGFNAHKAQKDVQDGIDFVKRYKIHVQESSVNLLKEIRNYKWKEDKNGHVLEEPVKFKDHLMDAMRYAIYTYGKEQLGKQPMSIPSAKDIQVDSITRKTLKIDSSRNIAKGW